MEDLINIANYCNTLLIRYGETLHTCNAVYLNDDKNLEFRIVYNFVSPYKYDSYQYIIPNFNFMMTETEVLVNKETISIINKEVEKRLNIKEARYEVKEESKEDQNS